MQGLLLCIVLVKDKGEKKRKREKEEEETPQCSKKKKRKNQAAVAAEKEESDVASPALAPIPLLPLAAMAHPSDVLDMPVDPNEPTYCLCHQVSYGEMIGCDNQDVSIVRVIWGDDWVW